MDEKEYIVTFPISLQFTEDSWKIINPTMKVTSSTTIAQIDAFYRKYYKLKDAEVEVKLIEISKPV